MGRGFARGPRPTRPSRGECSCAGEHRKLHVPPSGASRVTARPAAEEKECTPVSYSALILHQMKVRPSGPQSQDVGPEFLPITTPFTVPGPGAVLTYSVWQQRNMVTKESPPQRIRREAKQRVVGNSRGPREKYQQCRNIQSSRVAGQAGPCRRPWSGAGGSCASGTAARSRATERHGNSPPERPGGSGPLVSRPCQAMHGPADPTLAQRLMAAARDNSHHGPSGSDPPWSLNPVEADSAARVPGLSVRRHQTKPPFDQAGGPPRLWTANRAARASAPGGAARWRARGAFARPPPTTRDEARKPTAGYRQITAVDPGHF